MDIGILGKVDPGTLFIGALWGVYVIGQQVLQNLRTNKTQGSVDSASATLISNLQKGMNEFAAAGRDERERADRLSQNLNDMSQDMGGLRTELKYSTEEREELRKEVARLTSQVEQLVVEIRNKDKSIDSLVDMNRKILRSIGSTTDSLIGLDAETITEKSNVAQS